MILGEAALARLSASRVMVIGLGGVGSSCAEALARGGIGKLVLLDRDVVTPSNINRQALAFHSTLGRPKSEVMKQMVLDINPDCAVEAVRTFIDKDFDNKPENYMLFVISWYYKRVVNVFSPKQGV